MGMVQHGIYKEPWESESEQSTEEWEDLAPDELQKWLRVDGHTHRHTTGAGHPPSEVDNMQDTDMSSDMDADSLESVVISGTGSEMSSDTHSNHSSDTSSSDGPSIPQRVRDQVYHRPVSVPRIGCPFEPDLENHFLDQLEHVPENGQLPRGFGLRRGGDGYGEYSEQAEIAVGRSRARFLQVTLPEVEWRPRYVLWCQALTVVSLIMQHNL